MDMASSTMEPFCARVGVWSRGKVKRLRCRSAAVSASMVRLRKPPRLDIAGHAVHIPEAVVHENKEACRNDDCEQVNDLLRICHAVLRSVVRNGNRVLRKHAKEEKYAGGDENGEKMATAISDCA